MRRSDLPQDCVGPARHDGVGDCTYCQQFLEHDPAYTYLPNRRSQLSRDAARLAVRAHLSIARDQLIGHQVEPAMAELTSAIDVANNALIGARAEDAALRMIIGRVDALTEARTDDAGPGLDEAVELVEKAMSALGNSIRPELKKKLAKLLVKRGVWYGSACFEFRIPIDLARAVLDLRRALQLDPNSTWVRYNLAKGLIYHAGDLANRPAAQRLPLLIEAMLSVEGGIELAGPTSRLREAQEDGLEAIEALLLEDRSMDDLHQIIRSFRTDPAADLTGSAKANALDEAAERARDAGDLAGCAHYLVRAVRADPDTERLRAKLLAVLQELLREAPSQGAGA
jgi:tetratricopeptide (TPR) repeat protein